MAARRFHQVLATLDLRLLWRGRRIGNFGILLLVAGGDDECKRKRTKNAVELKHDWPAANSSPIEAPRLHRSGHRVQSTSCDFANRERWLATQTG
jgi:hypothetical protein